MNIHWIYWTGLVIFGACSVSRHRQAESVRTGSSNAVIQRADSLHHRTSLIGLSGRELHLGRELLAITPTGTFSYHPDSGFTGRAARVVVYRERIHAADSTQQLVTSETRSGTSQAVESRREAHAIEKQERTTRRLPALPWWAMAVAAVVALIILLLKFLRLRR